MAMSFSILWSVSIGPFFIYLLYLFSPQNDDIFYVIRNSIFFIDWNISETWTRIKLKQLSKMLLGSFSEKKNALFWRERSYLFSFFFSKTTVSYIKQVQISFVHVFSENIFKISCGIHDLQKCENNNNKKNFLKDVV